MDDLVAAYDLFDRDDRVRVVVLTADHTAFAFCSGVRDHKPTSGDGVKQRCFAFRRIFLRVGGTSLARTTSDRAGIVRAIIR